MYTRCTPDTVVNTWILLLLQRVFGLLSLVKWLVKSSCPFPTRATNFSLWWCTYEDWWVLCCWWRFCYALCQERKCKLFCVDLFCDSNPCRTALILIRTSNCTCSQIRRKWARGRRRQLDAPAIPLIMKWWITLYKCHQSTHAQTQALSKQN